MLESVLERGVPEMKADSAQADVGEHGIGLDVVGQHRTGDESGSRRRDTPHPQRAPGEPRERRREFVQPNGIAVDDEIPPP